MAYKARKTEHSGPKRGDGAYWGYKRDAKKESNRVRRRASKTVSLEGLIEALGDGLKQGFALSNEMGAGWTAAINRAGSPVALFETEGDISAEGSSPAEAVERLLAKLKERKKSRSS